MGLLDDEEVKLKKTQDGKKKPGKKTSNAGVGRFASLNKYSSLTNKYKNKKEAQKTGPSEKSEIKKQTEKVKFKKPVVSKPTIKTQMVKKLVEKHNDLSNESAGLPEMETNSKQTVSKKVTNGYQIDSKQVANSEQKDSNKVANSYQIVSKMDSKVGSKAPSEVTTFSYDHRTVIGNEKSILYIIYSECLKQGGLETPPMPLRIFSAITKLNSNVIKNVIFRLKGKNLIHVVERKAGRGGWSRYGITKELHQSFQKGGHSFEPNPHERLAKQVAKEIASVSSSSSVNLNLKNTTTNKPRTINELPKEWQEISLLHLDGIGFKEAHLIQIFNAGTEYELVSESLEALRHDVLRKKIPGNIQSPLGLIMSNLRVKKVPYSSFDPSFISETDKALAEMMRIKKERLLKKQKEREELFELEFEEWKSTLTRKQIKQILPSFVDENGQGADTVLKQHYKSEIDCDSL